MKPYFDDVKYHIPPGGQQLLACKGFTGVGSIEIRNAAEMPKGSFYYYFESKENTVPRCLSFTSPPIWSGSTSY